MRSQTQQPEDLNLLEQSASNAEYYDTQQDKDDEGLVRHRTSEMQENERHTTINENDSSGQND